MNCEHKNVIIVHDFDVCEDCGLELGQNYYDYMYHYVYRSKPKLEYKNNDFHEYCGGKSYKKYARKVAALLYSLDSHIIKFEEIKEVLEKNDTYWLDSCLKNVECLSSYSVFRRGANTYHFGRYT